MEIRRQPVQQQFGMVMARGAPRTSNNVGRSLAQGAGSTRRPPKGLVIRRIWVQPACAPAAVLAVLQHLRGSPRSNRRAQSIVPAAPIRLHSLRIKTTGRARHARARHVWQRLVAGYMAWSPLIAGYLMAFFLIFFAGAYIYGLGEFLTSRHHGLGRCHRVGRRRNRSAGHCQERSRSKRKERRNDREYNETQRSNDQAYAEKLRREGPSRTERTDTGGSATP